MFNLLSTESKARRGELVTPHGTVQTPAFMNVATCGAIKGAVSALDLKDIKCQVQLCNTYHLHLRPGDGNVKTLGGLHRFTRWNGPILTDSGGFQVFSLAKLRNIKEEGVTFNSHIDGRRIFMGPEESMTIQSNLGSTIAMAFDECVENPSPYTYTKDSVARTTRWLKRCIAKMAELNLMEDTINPQQQHYILCPAVLCSHDRRGCHHCPRAGHHKSPRLHHRPQRAWLRPHSVEHQPDVGSHA